MNITLKNAAEFEKMRVAGKLAADVLTMIGPHVKPGITTNQLNDICHDYIVNIQKAIPAPLNYRVGDQVFPKSICTSINNVICHGIPDDKTKLKKGDIINIDVTVIKDGYHGDTSKMFCVDEVNTRAKQLIQVTQECLYLAIRMVKPGVKLGDIGYAIQENAEKNEYSVVREYCGHGIGKIFHEDPQILHYGKKGTGLEIVPGMTFTIEPMINLGKPYIKLKHKKVPGGNGIWDVAYTTEPESAHHKNLSAQWEHTMGVTEDGVEVFTLREEETIF